LIFELVKNRAKTIDNFLKKDFIEKRLDC
jgi:hypothetical protein